MTTNSLRTPTINSILHGVRIQRGLAFGIIIITALFAFEMFNYSTTEYALSDLLGNLKFLGMNWATILAIAFCGIDFAGIARLFTPEKEAKDTKEVWYLFGAWLLAATMNAMLTWWGISLAIVGHETLGSAVIGRETLLHIAPIFVAVLVWLIRVLIIGTFSVAGIRLFSQTEQLNGGRGYQKNEKVPMPVRSIGSRMPSPRPVLTPNAIQNAPKPIVSGEVYSRPEPTYHPISMSANSRNAEKTSNNASASSSHPKFMVRQ